MSQDCKLQLVIKLFMLSSLGHSSQQLRMSQACSRKWQDILIWDLKVECTSPYLFYLLPKIRAQKSKSSYIRICRQAIWSHTQIGPQEEIIYSRIYWFHWIIVVTPDLNFCLPYSPLLTILLGVSNIKLVDSYSGSRDIYAFNNIREPSSNADDDYARIVITECCPPWYTPPSDGNGVCTAPYALMSTEVFNTSATLSW